MPRSTFNEFASRHSKDQRFRVVEKLRDRESYFHEYIQELRTREKDGSHRRTDKETVRHFTSSHCITNLSFFFQLKKDYFAMLKELNVTRNSSWSETKRAGEHDSRYKSIESSSRREDWFRDYQSKHADETAGATAEVKLSRFSMLILWISFRSMKKNSNVNVKKNDKNELMLVSKNVQKKWKNNYPVFIANSTKNVNN